ncbi:cytochrome P450 [Phanerochaete sordida]|uniref:Cytochrome P450 n=1 Tax=Phanerochaete sordida TaxID=48140 RepID=A0A9P3GC97_9APHY|nr:cytochrome P450 [Phanerochaete sordida]
MIAVTRIIAEGPLIFLAMLSLSSILLVSLRRWYEKRGKRSILPPGPRGLPFIGNLLQLPRDNTLLARPFADLSRQYGPIYYLRVINTHFVIVNDLNMARTLFEKRSAIYSHRPRVPMVNDVIKRDTMLFMNYGAAYRQSRRLVATFLNPRIASKYWPAQEAESIKFALGVRKAPQDVQKLTRWTATSLIIRLVYGLEVTGKDDPLVSLAEDFSRLTADSTTPGRWLVDSFPILRHIPTWFPGAGFKRWAMRAKARMDEFAYLPYQVAKDKITQGDIAPSWTAEKLLESIEPPTGQEEKEIRHTATSLYSGGSDTTNAMVSSFVLLMLHYPEVQQKAQAEVDRVTGGAWVPRMHDREQFPYLDCVLKELFRFNPAVPLVPHSLHQDDFFEGYLIPKDAWVIANLWGFMHDETRYPDPDVFMPERFEANTATGRVPQEDPLDIVFGFGRRSCPGYLLALASVYLNVVHLLFAFDIVPAKDEAGNDDIPPVAFIEGHVSHPKHFKCHVRERSAERMTLLEHTLASLQ